MNWITRCPECATVYRVEPDQLQVAKGWLRCGHCQHVFDSTGLILAWSGAVTASFQDAIGSASTERLAIEDLLKQEDRSPSQMPSAAVDLASFEEALSSFKPEIEKTIAKLSTTPLAVDASDDLDGAADWEPPVPSHRRVLSIFWFCVLLAGLLGQWLWVERHAVAARWPVMAEPFKAVCRAISCDAELLRDVQVMVIDSSSFIQRDEGHELSWTVRNAGEQVLAMTALELTLLDAQGKPVLRRVLLPADVDAPKFLMPGQIWTGQLHMRVDLDIPVAGYRILSFYP